MAWIRDEDFDKIFERIFKQMNLDEPNSRSWRYGYSMTTGPDGKPVFAALHDRAGAGPG